MKFLKIFLALVLIAIISNPAFADEFDPVSDLYSEDALLNLDLPADFEEEFPVEMSEAPVFESPFAGETIETPTPPSANDPEEVETGSGGAIEDYSSEISTIKSPVSLSQPSDPASAISKISSFSYTSRSAAILAPTGPEAAFSIALLLTLPAAWALRKFSNA